MKETILMLGGGLIAGIIIMYLKNFIINKFKKQIPKLISEEDKIKIKELYNKGLVSEKIYKEACDIPEPTECFNKDKLITGLTKINNATLWAKDIVSIFNLRKLIIVGVIMGLFFGYGYWRGQQGKPIVIDWRGKEEFVRLNEHYLHIQKDGSMQVLDGDKKTVLKDIKVKDLENFRKYLRPYGLIFEPIVVGGFGISNAIEKFEGGIGLRYAKFFKWYADICATNGGFYPFGVSYKLTENSAIGLSLGTGFKQGERGFFEKYLLKFTIKF